MRTSNNYFTPKGNLVDGFDYNLQVADCLPRFF